MHPTPSHVARPNTPASGDAPAAIAGSVMARLKQETVELHHLAESHPFQRAMVSGSISRVQYVRWLEQMLLVHRCLEGHLRRARSSEPDRCRAIDDSQYREAALLEDIAHCGGNKAPQPLPGAAALIRDIDQARNDTAALLGFHYVLEGSTNGSKYIAAALRMRLGLAEGPGTRYLDPYGDSQRARWKQFRQDMDSIGFSKSESDTMVKAAAQMFEGIRRISDDLQVQS